MDSKTIFSPGEMHGVPHSFQLLILKLILNFHKYFPYKKAEKNGK